MRKATDDDHDVDDVDGHSSVRAAFTPPGTRKGRQPFADQFQFKVNHA